MFISDNINREIIISGIIKRKNNAHEEGMRIVKRTIKCGDETAMKVVDLLVKNKLAFLDSGVGQFRVKNGAYLEKQSLLNAVTLIKGE